MEFRGRFRVVRRQDHAMPPAPPKPLLGRERALDVRAWPFPGGPLLLVNAPRKSGPAVHRNRFRRRVRMAFLELLRESRAGACVVWVRPAKGGRCDLSYHDIEGQLRLALSRLDPA